MTEVHKIARLSVVASSIDPLCGIVEIDTPNTTVRFELNEDMAHSFCTDLERFLTQAPRREQDRARRG
ncbi:hypothetical protein LJR220_001279 [Bradyrhizobium sp. LjRoot220]|uniref:hypothetical protein n=1 Tax=Bradyrhizobium sp. LjRoot220 TaxID=3342284 RepID=UPI003ECF6236